MDATYRYARFGTDLENFCQATPELTTSAELGTLQLLPNGDFLLVPVKDYACLSGGTGSIGLVQSGTYQHSLAGDLVLDFDSTLPGTDIENLRVSWDRQLLVGQIAEDSAPGLLIGVRLGAGMNDSVLQGSYTVASAGHNFQAGALESGVGFGSLTFDGAGGYAVSTHFHEITAAGSVMGVDSGSGSYAVAPNGMLSADGISNGAVTSDGRFGFLLESGGTGANLIVFSARPSTPITPGALDGTWYLNDYLIEPAVPHSATTYSETIGSVNIDTTAGSYSLSGTGAWVDTTSGGVMPVTDAGTLSLNSVDGSLVIDASSPPAVLGWVAEGEDLILIGQTFDSTEGSIGILLRERGTLVADVAGLSVVSGGVQTLSIGAGNANGLLLYLMLGSTSGHYPGLPFAGESIPLNYDAYTQYTLLNPNGPILSSSFGVLDADGKGAALFQLPAGASPGIIGLDVGHACVVLDLADPDSVRMVTNAVSLEILP